MKLNPKNGVDDLIFGMKTKDVELLYGKPNKHFLDEDQNTIYLYNEKKLRLTFYEDEDFKLGYIITSNPNATFLDQKIIGSNTKNLVEVFISKGIKQWEIEDFDSTENHFNETNWLTLQSEFETVIRIEIGAIFDDNDEMVFKFKA